MVRYKDAGNPQRVFKVFALIGERIVKAPHNTAEDARRHPEMLVAEAMMDGGAGMIPRQEKAGQSDFVNSDTLPTKIDSASMAALEAAGAVGRRLPQERL